MKLAFYTYFYGSNSNPNFRIPGVPSLKYDCYYYTNNKVILERLKETKWIGIFDNKPITDNLIESCMIGKHLKTMPHKYVELIPYDYLCFLDNKVEQINEIVVEEFIVKYFIDNNYALLLREHIWIKHSVMNEYNESMFQERYRIESNNYQKYIQTQLKNGLSENVEKHCMCGFLIRNMRHEKNNELSTTWYQHIQDCGIQDQISFFFVKQLFSDIIYPFTETPFKVVGIH
jgi:hypothetical protein